MKKNIVFLFLSLFLIQISYAQKPDNRVVEVLKSLNFKYSVQEDDSFKFTVPINKRTQTIFISSETTTYDKLEMREVYSIIHESNQIPDQSKLIKLLIDNGQKKIGAWEIVYEGSAYFIIYTVKINANADASDLKSAIDIVATASDLMEQQLFVTDAW
jgi:hypothetical protein